MKYLLLILLMICQTASAQSRIKSIDKGDSTLARLDKIEGELAMVKVSRDSLTKELYYFRQKEDLYIGLFERYGGKLDNLITIIFGVIGFFSLGGVVYIVRLEKQWSEVKSVKVDVSSLKNEIQSSLIETNHNMATTMAHLGSLRAQNVLNYGDVKEGWVACNAYWESLNCAQKAIAMSGNPNENGAFYLVADVLEVFCIILGKLDRKELADETHRKGTVPYWLRDERPLIGQLMSIPDLQVQKWTSNLNLLIIEFYQVYKASIDSRRSE
ncbi:hypothetical protein LZD49_12370 [Dyadobacter sp. CY261]|uniref:hypothetical protein n=1 Tax=Dyadobacter sp. CY261 TaxID=2907203 RepID=UPI001F3F10E8|nr:hypothetical protein [Dyadobacter sp. CY261]MCF0071267.1 hypothetical protein [Dyadobacter sp. CY261]